MVTDSSALIAVLENEPEGRAFRAAIEADRTRLVSTAPLVEASIVVLCRRGEAGLDAFHGFTSAADVVASPIEPNHVALAVASVSTVRQKPPSCGFELRGLLPLRVGAGNGRTFALQGHRFQPH